MAKRGHKRGRRSRLSWRTVKRWLWYREADDVGPDECLLRAIPNAIGYFSEKAGKWSVSPYAFTPNKKRDPDGLSFYREDFVTPKQVADECKHPMGGRVARLKVSDLLKHGLLVKPSQSNLPGHVIMPSMRYSELVDPKTKKTVNAAAVLLAELASQDIAYSPPELSWPKKPAKPGPST